LAEVTARRPIGPGRVLLGGYTLFVVAAGARSAVQWATHGQRAPLAYALSAVAALIYLVGLVLLARVDRDPGASRRAAAVCCLVEFSGVLAVGAASVLWPAAFPDATVWSGFGQGYGYVPVVLPLLAAFWLHRGRPRT
jgi:hypothetical protein